MTPLRETTAQMQRGATRGHDADRKASAGECLIAFLLGLGSHLNVRLIGYLPFSELAVLLALPFLLPRLTSRDVLKRTGWVLPLAGLWLVSLAVTDAFRATDWSLSARGIARIIVLLTAIPFAVYFFRRSAYEKFLWFTVGIIPSIVISAFAFRSGVHEGREIVYGSAVIDWKTHWAALAAAAASLGMLVLYKRGHAYGYSVSVGTGLLNLLNGSRAEAAILMLSPLVTMAYNTLSSRIAGARRRMSAGGLATAGLAALGFAVLIYYGYSFAARERLLGEREFLRHQAQSRNAFGMFVGGRPAILSAYLAISNSPFIGYGSWPIDRWEFNRRGIELAGLKPPADIYKRGYPLIDSHSHIFQAWVESGVFGAVFWIYIFWLMARSLFLPIHDERRLRLALSAAAISCCWHILFSPIAARLELSFVLGVILTQPVPRAASPIHLTRPAALPVRQQGDALRQAS